MWSRPLCDEENSVKRIFSSTSKVWCTLRHRLHDRHSGYRLEIAPDFSSWHVPPLFMEDFHHPNDLAMIEDSIH
jgi:hypothetical protein